MGSSFTQKLIELDITLNSNPNPITNQVPFFSTNTVGSSVAAGNINQQNSVTISNARVSARVQYAGRVGGSTATVKVFGLIPSLMNELSTLGIVFQAISHNTLTIKAGDQSAGLATVFTGTIFSAYADFNQAPDSPVTFECLPGGAEAVIPAAAFSSNGQPVQVASVMQQIAQQAGWGFENNGVTAVLPPSYFPGTLTDQYKKLATDANIEAELVPGTATTQTLAIWPRGGSRNLTPPLISPGTGMIGYPTYSQIGLTVKTHFNPNIGLGGPINIQSSLPRATGAWIVLRMDHALDSLMPDGAWESTLSCYNPGFAAKYGIPVPP